MWGHSCPIGVYSGRRYIDHENPVRARLVVCEGESYWIPTSSKRAALPTHENRSTPHHIHQRPHHSARLLSRTINQHTKYCDNSRKNERCWSWGSCHLICHGKSPGIARKTECAVRRLPRQASLDFGPESVRKARPAKPSTEEFSPLEKVKKLTKVYIRAFMVYVFCTSSYGEHLLTDDQKNISRTSCMILL